MKADTGKRIKKWREDRGLSQLAAANGAKISQSEWQKLETGRSKNPSYRTVRRIVAYMGGAISADDFGDGKKLPVALDSTADVTNEAKAS